MLILGGLGSKQLNTVSFLRTEAVDPHGCYLGTQLWFVQARNKHITVIETNI
jgi:hypothetical protein